MNLRDSLLAARGRLRREPAAVVPELSEILDGQALYIRELTAAERDEFEASRWRTRYLPDGNMRQEMVYANFRTKLLSLALCDEQGQRLFAESDVAQLSELPAVMIERWFDQAARLSGIVKKENEAPGKNSSSAGGDGSPSPSPSPAVNGT